MWSEEDMSKQNGDGARAERRSIGQASATTIVGRLAAVRHRIAIAASDAGRDPRDVTLVCVSKGHPEEAIEAAIEAGELVFGENRVQEAKAKWGLIRERHPDTALHLI